MNIPELKQPSIAEIKVTVAELLQAIQEFGKQYAPAIPALIDMVARLAK